MIADLLRGLRFAAITLAVVSGAYPLAVWSIGQVAFPVRANGSLVTGADGHIVGSSLVAQAFTGERYFHSRPSGVDYNAASTGGTNYGPTNPDHLDAVRTRVAAVRTRERLVSIAVPADLVTASGAGLDPHLSPQSIAIQVGRVAAARGVTTDAVRRLVAAHTEPPTLGVLGRARVNVVLLNLALDAAFPATSTPRLDTRS
ncbi:MAG TPA: potassium-transporting ATPase subunit KdpC [Luteitalea sp.]|nr:potassium-transporting ATPase subunit KdpC [Luteitalea sp.]